MQIKNIEDLQKQLAEARAQELNDAKLEKKKPGRPQKLVVIKRKIEQPQNPPKKKKKKEKTTDNFFFLQEDKLNSSTL